MSEFVCVRKVATVPRHTEIAAVKRCCREVASVSLRVIWHHALSDVSVHDFCDCFIQLDELQVGNE